MELQHYLMKQQRCEYFNVQHQFASVLTGLSNALATIPDHAQRQLSLRECLGLPPKKPDPKVPKPHNTRNESKRSRSTCSYGPNINYF
eukprot:5775321-Amphidinium_carterae.1